MSDDTLNGAGDAPYGRRASTIRDVAALAGVSKSTASRAVMGQGGVSPANAEKVKRAVAQLDFVPNEIARSMTARPTAVLGLFLRHLSSAFYGHLASEFEGMASGRGYEVLSLASNDQPEEANYRSLMLLADLRMTGIVVAAPTVDPHTIRKVASRVPLVLVGQMGQPSNPGVPYVAPDPRDGATLIEHVTGLGHRSIALLAVPPEISPTQWARISWMRDELQRSGLLARLEILPPGSALDDVITSLHRDGVTAVLCSSDAMACDAIAAANHRGLSIPRDLSIAGWDGIPPYDHELLGLTTHTVPVSAMAETAVALIDALAKDHEPSTSGILLPGRLIVGRTTGPAPA